MLAKCSVRSLVFFFQSSAGPSGRRWPRVWDWYMQGHRTRRRYQVDTSLLVRRALTHYPLRRKNLEYWISLVLAGCTARRQATDEICSRAWKMWRLQGVHARVAGKTMPGLYNFLTTNLLDSLFVGDVGIQALDCVDDHSHEVVRTEKFCLPSSL